MTETLRRTPSTQGRFAVMPARAVDDNALSPTAFIVLAALGIYGDRDGWCYPAQGTIAKRLGVSRSRVNQCIRELIQLGYIAVRHCTRNDGGRAVNQYRIIFDADLPVERERGAEPTPPVNPELTPPVNAGLTPPCKPRAYTMNSPGINAPEERRETTAHAVGADAPAPTRPLPLAEWRDLTTRSLRDAPNQQAVAAILRTSWVEIFGSRDPPDYGRLMKMAKAAGGAGQLVRLMVQAASSEITDDPADYITGIIRRRSSDAKHDDTRAGRGGATPAAGAHGNESGDRDANERRRAMVAAIERNPIPAMFRHLYEPGRADVPDVRRVLPDDGDAGAVPEY